MTGYGGFGVAMTARYSTLVSILLELGFNLAIPHIRGGGEFGRTWHEAARRQSRQIALDDFIAAAEWLRRTRLTSPERLGLVGGSNAGLLMAGAMVQRPDLFGAVVCIAPLLDMVRYEVFDHAARWREEYGTVEDEQEFLALHAYSPYHRVREFTDYPPTLFVSGDKDERCNPAHTRKMVALLKGRQAQRSPVLLDYLFERGHSPGLPKSQRIEALVRKVAFLCQELNVPIEPGGVHETAFR
jgi:prolyl oligopeptidase